MVPALRHRVRCGGGCAMPGVRRSRDGAMSGRRITDDEEWVGALQASCALALQSKEYAHKIPALAAAAKKLAGAS